MKKSLHYHIYKIWLLKLMADWGNFKKVATHAGMTSSALSQNLTSLESFFGKTLLVREKNKSYLTEAGHSLVAEFAEVLDLIERASPDKKINLGEKKLKIGAYESIAISLIPRILPTLKQKYPGLQINLLTQRSHALCSMVRKGELDAALIIESELDEGLQIQSLAEERFGLYVSARHPIQDLNLEKALALGLATIRSDEGGYPLYYKQFVKAVGNPPVVVTTDSFETVRSIVLSGVVVGLLPSRVANRYPEELKEITPKNLAENKKGLHKISIISRKNMDQHLRELIVSEIVNVI